MSLQDDFKSFLHDIEPKKSTVDEIASAHKALRSYLENHEHYSRRCLKTYLSGSYAKRTSIRPVKNEDHRDVDVVVETNYSTSESSADAIVELRDVLRDTNRYKSAHLQTHSVGITLSKLDIDVVPLATDGNARFIGNLHEASWKETDPQGHIEWSSQTNSDLDGQYVPLVKMMKWWRREHCPETCKWPKGITFEKIIADCFPETSNLYEELMIGLMENIVDSLSDELEAGEVPFVVDPALPTNNLATNYTIDEFRSFVSGLKDSLRILQDEGSNNESWRKVLGSCFPSTQGRTSGPALAKPVLSIEEALRVTHRHNSPWPLTKRRPGVVIVVADVTFKDGHTERISSNGRTIPKGCEIDYRIIRSKGLAYSALQRARFRVLSVHRSTMRRCCTDELDTCFPRGVKRSPHARERGKHGQVQGDPQAHSHGDQPAQRGLLRRMRRIHGAGRAARGEEGGPGVATAGGHGRLRDPLQDIPSARQV